LDDDAPFGSRDLHDLVLADIQGQVASSVASVVSGTLRPALSSGQTNAGAHPSNAFDFVRFNAC
ncbi:MAG: hypothetical protein KDE06_09965, partial [Rhodobacteraceae bacterium]|nr:hypothetical protein [Paracoccaceae bacterium]MCB2151442.1 hypothetical protein [Paracoccaceae bacterium]